ncbi:MAG: PhzF family phenazine biosynthesis protein [Polaromonas sp.]
MKQRLFKQVDVFTATPYFGNPLAVVLDGSGLSDDEMQRFARWTNLSETTFLLPPTDPSADYRVRIFTPGGELPFAGHPTLGSCHGWLQAGGQPQGDVIVQQCEAGLVRIRREPALQRLAFAAPPLRRSAPDPALLAGVMQALGIKPEQVLASQNLDNGPVWLTLLLGSVDTVLALTPDLSALGRLKADVGIAALYPAQAAPPLIARANREARAFTAPTLATTCAALPPEGAGLAWGGPARRPSDADFDTPDLEVRGFAVDMGVNEDPVTGSLQAGLAQWLIAEGRLQAPYLASQGACLGRAGLVYVECDGQGQVWVGGDSVTCVEGQVLL